MGNEVGTDGKLVIDVVNGDVISNIPGLLDHYATIIVPYGDVIDEQEKAALDAHADKLIVESPQIYAKTVLTNVNATDVRDTKTMVVG